jgi:3-hydroxyacyl-CoA dehydrogenase
MAKVGTSALESRKLGYLLDDDIVVPHKDELLFVAIAQAKAMVDAGWRAPGAQLFPVAGPPAHRHHQGPAGQHARRRLHQRARLPHRQPDRRRDLRRRRRRRAPGDEEYLMALERKHFCALLEHPKTQERIMGMLQTGKPVRN